MAKRYADGKMPETEVRSWKENFGSFDLIEAIASEIGKQGPKYDRSQIKITVNPDYERTTWLDKITNFLKHADWDPDDKLPLDEVDIEHILMAGCAAYMHLMKGTTPEIIVYGGYWLKKNSEYGDTGSEDEFGGFQKVVQILDLSPPATHRRECAKLIRKLKRIEQKAARKERQKRGFPHAV
jgi:hypothetical protein